MKFSQLRIIAILAFAATLAACGGKASFAVQGTITGLKTDGLVLANGGDTVTVPAAATSFVLPNQISYGTSFAITVSKQPAHMTCSVVSGGSGSAGYTIAIAAIVQCVQNSYTIGGQYSGLSTDSVVLTNGTTGGTVTLTAPTDGTVGAGDFVFGTAVPDGQAYGVTVLTQPVGLTCSVANGTGVMHETAVTNLVLTCAP